MDLPPLYDPLTKPMRGNNYLADAWRDWFATFIQTLTTYLSSNGIFLPNLTTAQRDALQSPANGQMIYNIDSAVQAPQVFQNGAWKTFTTS